jgi:hypothetical protein
MPGPSWTPPLTTSPSTVVYANRAKLPRRIHAMQTSRVSKGLQCTICAFLFLPHISFPMPFRIPRPQRHIATRSQIAHVLILYLKSRAWFLNITQRDNGSKYSDFIKSQADKVLTLAVGSKPGWYTNLWCAANAGGAQSTGSSQGSALGALVAAGQQNC